MSIVSGFAGSQNTDVVTIPFIDNLSVPLANTEVSYTLPTNTRRFILKNRSSGMLKLSYTSGQSGVKWFSIEPGNSYSETNISKPSLTIYLQSPTANQILEILSWS